jgi:pimeloyl-ACP methyl ester carboxylesterase
MPVVLRDTEVRPGLFGLPSKSEIDVFDEIFPALVEDVVGTVYVPRVRGIRRVLEGTIASPSTLDPETRARREDGRWSREDVHFLMTLPAKPPSGGKVPVVMFGHGLVTDRRFVLMIAGKLAEKGFAAIAFDFPFHGRRTRCTDKTLAAIPNFFPEDIRRLTPLLADDMLTMPACRAGSTCNPDGRCETRDGVITDYASIPLTDMPVAGGSALIDVTDLPHISDRMRQAVVDMSAVRRSLRAADWARVTGGIELERQRVYYAGQSLGGILGAVFVALADDVERAVLNVPGADLVGLFRESTYFKPQMDAFLAHERLVDGSYEQARLLNVARWLMDTVDPHSVAHLLGRKQAMMQMSRGDIVIPNRVTERLRRASKLPMETYPSPLHGDLVIPVLGDAMLDDLVTFLSAQN